MAVESTQTVLVRGLDDEGPGDIVGAFVGEADVDPDAIREIEIDGGEATVEVDASVADRVISPYDDRVDLIERRLESDDVKVDTVDGFQGREKEVVLVPLVRSNDRGEVGFLDDPRRFNAVLTCARRKAVIVGDGDTVTAAPVDEAFVDDARRRGRAVDLAALDGAERP